LVNIPYWNLWVCVWLNTYECTTHTYKHFISLKKLEEKKMFWGVFKAFLCFCFSREIENEILWKLCGTYMFFFWSFEEFWCVKLCEGCETIEDWKGGVLEHLWCFWSWLFKKLVLIAFSSLLGTGGLQLSVMELLFVHFSLVWLINPLICT